MVRLIFLFTRIIAGTGILFRLQIRIQGYGFLMTERYENYKCLSHAYGNVFEKILSMIVRQRERASLVIFEENCVYYDNDFVFPECTYLVIRSVVDETFFFPFKANTLGCMPPRVYKFIILVGKLSVLLHNKKLILWKKGVVKL